MKLYNRHYPTILGLLALSCSQALAPEGRILSLSPMYLPRAGHTSTLLANGTVLIAGGCVAEGCEGRLTNSSELYDPKTDGFSSGPELNLPRVGHRAVALVSGKVLILGGWAGQNATATIELYDPQTNRFELVGQMKEPRDGFTATLLQDGRVLIAGGYNGRMQRLASAELFDPIAFSSVAVKPMNEVRMAHSASLLTDGRVLIVGGSPSRDRVLASAEVFDPKTQAFNPVGSLSIPRHKHATVTLKNGNVLVVGGARIGDFSQQYNTTELFDPKTAKFRSGPSMSGARFKLPDAVELLPSGEVLIAGSDPVVEVYDPVANRFKTIAGGLEMELSYTTATALADGRVLIAGGYDNRIRVMNKAWVFQ